MRPRRPTGTDTWGVELMIIGFSRHGTGGGRGPVEYITSQERAGREAHPPQILRGSPDNTCLLIDSLAFEHRYTSGVLSFAPGETIGRDVEQAIMDRFEQVAFAGLEPDQYNILWVRHLHADHHELHFVTPRVELSTGKSLNIRPPGEMAKQTFDDLRSEINARYGLSDPTDPSRAKDVATPDHILKIAAEARRDDLRAIPDPRRLLNEIVAQRAAEGLIRHRDDLVEQVKELGFGVPRQGKDYITVSDPESGERWRMRGPLYEREFTPGRTLAAYESAGERTFGEPDQAAAERFAQRVERHIAARAEYHTQRYSQPVRGLELRVPDHAEKPALAADQEQNTLPGPDGVQRLGDYLAQRLGSLHLAGGADSPELAHVAGTKTDVGHPRAENLGPDVGSRVEWPLHRSAEERDDSQRLDLHTGGRKAPGDIAGEEEINHDRTGESLVDRVEIFVHRIQRATEALKAGAGRITQYVREYIQGEQGTPRPGKIIKSAGERITAGADGIWQPLREEQAIASEIKFQQKLAADEMASKAQRQLELEKELTKGMYLDGPSL